MSKKEFYNMPISLRESEVELLQKLCLSVSNAKVGTKAQSFTINDEENETARLLLQRFASTRKQVVTKHIHSEHRVPVDFVKLGGKKVDKKKKGL